MHHDELMLRDEFQPQLELRGEQLPQLLVHHDELMLRDEFQLQLELRGEQLPQVLVHHDAQLYDRRALFHLSYRYVHLQ